MMTTPDPKSEISAWYVDIVSPEEDNEHPLNDVRSRETASTSKRKTAKKTPVLVTELANNLESFTRAATLLVTRAADAAAELQALYQLDEVKVTAVIESNGQFGFQGTSIGGRVEGGLELTFKRKT